MAQYIDKDALVAEIESKRKYAQTLGDNAINSSMQQFCDGMKHGCVDILSFIDTLEAKEVDLEKEKIKKASILHSFAIRNQEVEDEDFIEGAEWAIRQMRGEPVSEQKLSNVERTVKDWKEEPVSEDLEQAAKDYSNNLDNIYGSIGEQTRKAFKTGAKWKKEQMMKDTTEVTVHIDAGGYPYIPQIELYDYDNDIPLAKEGDRYKVVLIKED